MKHRERRDRIIEILKETPYITNGKLVETLGVSLPTIRRDLATLAEEGKINRVRGGAEPVKDYTVSHPVWEPFDLEDVPQKEEKRRIAEKAADLCETGESVIIDGGTTTNLMVEFLVDKNLQVLTNALHTAIDLIKNTNSRVILPGGEVFREQKVILSPFENDTIKQYARSKLFMGTRGISSFGYTQWDPLLIQAQQKLMNQADQIIVLADSTKFTQRGSYIICQLSEVDIVITDDKVRREDVDMLEKEGVEVYVV